MDTGLYIHIPFCAAKCGYCDFTSFASASNQEEYKNALINELAMLRELAGKDIRVDTVFIGGGTPTVLPVSFLREILDETRRFPITQDAEISCEANPGTLTEEKLSVLRRGGVNRLSIGLQAVQARLLNNIMRAGAGSGYFDMFVKQYNSARAAGFENINIDLMFALPGQSCSDWCETLAEVVRLNPEHISAYALTLEEGTPLWERLNGKYIERNASLVPCGEDEDRQMYRFAQDFLAQHGYIQYEISNFAKHGCGVDKRCRHNLRYWQRKLYLGAGLGSHSFFTGNKIDSSRTDSLFRCRNTEDLQKYLEANGDLTRIREDETEIDRSEAISETMFLGLRLTEGVEIAAFESAFGVSPRSEYGDWIEQMIREELLRESATHLYLTRRGMDFANRVMAGFV